MATHYSTIMNSNDVARLINSLSNLLGKTMARNKPKIIWVRLPGNKLKATWEVAPRGMSYGLNEEDMDPIQTWCQENGCGVRLSFDLFRFNTAAEVTAFLLKWQ